MMTNLPHGAHVANKLFSTIARLRLLLVMFLTLTVSAEVWGAEETITLSDFGWSNATVQSSITATSATISLAKNSAGTAPTYYTSDGLRLYGVKSATTGGTISFTPKTGVTISKIVFTHTSSNSGVLAIKTGVGSYSSKTWSGTLTEGNSVSLVSTNNTNSNPQVKITKIVITYTTSSGGGTGDSGDGSGDDSGECTWQLVTDASTLKVGDEIVIAASNVNYALSTTQNSNNRSATAITKSNNTITFNEAVQIITLAQGSTTGTLSFFVGSGYLYAASSSKNYLRTQTTPGTNGDWIIGINNEVATIQAQGDFTNNVIRYNPNSGNPIFACYASTSTTGSLPSIYKKVCTTETTYSVTIDPNIKNGTVTANPNSATAGTEIALTAAPETGYQFRSWTVTKEGGGTVEVTNNIFTMPASNVTVSATFEALPKLTTPTNLGADNITTTSATLTWDWNESTFEAQLQNYNVYIYDATGTNQLSGPVTATDKSLSTTKINGLTLSPGTTYKFKVVALSKNQAICLHSNESDWGTFTTSELPKYTVSFRTGTGNPTQASITESEGGAGIVLPAGPTPACTDWTFAGWAEESVTETTTEPTLLSQGNNYEPTADITLYAVYSYTEAGGGGSGFYLSVTQGATTYYIGEKGSGSFLSAVTDVNSAATFNIENNQYLYYGNKTYVSSTSDNTSLTIATTTPSATWAITDEGETITFKSNGTGGRYLAFNYNNGSPRFSSYGSTYTYELTKHTTSTTTYNSNPSCEVCENILSINKGEETNGNTFTLSQSGNVETCDGDVEVVVTPTPAEHYSVSAVTATTPTTGGAPTVTDNDNGTYTITYAANSKGTSTINVTFAEDAKATIKLYELGVLKTIATEYVGDKYTLPSTSSQSCGTKTLVGWSTKAFAETDTRPTENYYGISTQITLAETQTFYAVFAQSNGGGGGNGDYARVTEALDDWSGDYLIAYNDQTFANGSTGGKEGMGAEGNKEDLYSHIDNNTIPASIGDLYNVTLVAIDGGYVLQTKDGQYNYQTNNSNGLANTKDIETAKKYPLTVTFKNENDIAIANSAGAVFHYNKNQTGYFRFYEDGGQQPVYLYKKSGTAATYTGYTTSCAVITGIEVANPKTDFKQYDEFVFGGTVYAVDENDNRIDVTSSATFSGYDMKKAGTDTVTVTYLTHSTTYEITIEKVNAYALTWNVSGATNTGLAPAYVVPGSAIGTLPTPKEIPAGCEGKTFVGWTESNTVNSDGTEITFIKSTTVPSQATTYYAVFATPSGNAGDGDYVKVTEDANDLSGEYLIVYEAGSLAFDGKLTTLDAASNTISVTISSNTIASTDATDAAEFTIAKDGEGDYTIKSTSGKYIGKTANDNELEESESTPYKNTITFTDGNADIIASGGAYLRYNKNSGAERFRYYKSSTYNQQQPIALYKKSGSSASYTDYTTGCHDVTITYYGFTGGYTTNCGGSDLNVITTRVNSSHTIPNCGNITDPTDLGRTFLNLWKDQNGKVHQPGETFIVTQDITLYAQWKLETTGDVELSADQEDLATTNIVVTGGHTLTIPEGETITINSLTLKGGLLGEDSNSGYAMPSVVIPDGATLVRKNTTINFDIVVNADSWYPFAVPFAVKDNGNIDYLDPTLKGASTYNTHFAIKTYDGANRAIVGTDQENNWDKVKQTAGLQPGKGYIISALTYPDKDTATIRIPMTVDNAWLADGEQESITVKEQTTTRNQVTVTAYTGDAATEHQRHAGWNFVANPYLSMFAGGNVANDVEYIKGSINIQNQYTYEDTEVTYVTIPAYNFSYYEQVKLSEAMLSPEYSFFVQIGTGGTMSFATIGRQQAPAHLAARAAEQPIKMDVDITLSDDNHSDQTGLIICDRFSDAYEIGHDLEKMFGSAYNLSVYTLMADNTPLAFQALAIQNSMQVIPVGYRTPAQSEYTFALNEATSDIELLNEQYEQLILVDYETGALTNMLNNEYTFYSDRTQSNNRFALYAVPRQNTTTDLPNAIGNEEVKKVIYNDHFYILRDGKVFNGAGQIVK